MSLDVEAPEPPELSPVETAADDAGDQGGEYRRESIQESLEDGAWERAFEEWAAHTDLDEAEWQIVRDLELTREFDFFWDEFAERIGYRTPGVPEDWRERDLHPELDSWGTASGINAALSDLGRTVCELLRSEYVDWEIADEEDDTDEDR